MDKTMPELTNCDTTDTTDTTDTARPYIRASKV